MVLKRSQTKENLTKKGPKNRPKAITSRLFKHYLLHKKKAHNARTLWAFLLDVNSVKQTYLSSDSSLEPICCFNKSPIVAFLGAALAVVFFSFADSFLSSSEAT
jgi:hypothetical protein